MLLKNQVVLNCQSKDELNNHALQYSIYRAGRVERNYRLRRKKLIWKDYPSCVVCLECLDCGNLYYAGSGDKYADQTNFCDALNKITSYKLNPHIIGDVFGTCDHSVGNCAEFQGFDKYLRGCRHAQQYDPVLRKMDIQPQCLFILSSAYRPRTQEYIARCAYCQSVFGDEI